MDVLHCDLEAVEAARLGQLDLGRESLAEVLVDNAIRRGEESENVFDEVLLVLAQLIPVGHVVLRWQVRARRSRVRAGGQCEQPEVAGARAHARRARAARAKLVARAKAAKACGSRGCSKWCGGSQWVRRQPVGMAAVCLAALS